MGIELGSRWLLHGQVRVVVAREEDRVQGACLGGPAVCAVREERKGGKPHWTDWMEEKRLERHGTPIGQDEDVPVVERKTVAQQIEAASTSARRRKPMTPERRLSNRITSTRYRIKHPEKSGRSEWTPTELRDMLQTIDEAVAELARLKEAS